MSIALEHLSLMARNNAYANDRLLEACCELDQAQFAAERSGFFPSIRETLNHICEVDRYYLDALKEEGRGRSVYDAPPIDTAAELRAVQQGLDRSLISFCDDLREADLERTVAQDRSEKGRHFETIGTTLLHLFQHQVHHRGQVHAMLSGTGVAPPQLDEFFLKFERHPVAESYL